MAKERWLIDFDSVLGDLQVAQIASCNAQFGTSYTLDQVTTWDWWFTNTPREHSAYVWGPEVFNSREWTTNLPSLPGAIDGLYDLMGLGIEPVIVTDRKPYMSEWVHTWLHYQAICLPVVTSDRNHCPKITVAEQLGLTSVIEDAPHHAREMADSGKFNIVYLMDQPWNRDVAESGNLIRVSSWTEILNIEQDVRNGKLVAA